MKRYNLRRIFSNTFEDHEGRPGEVGGSVPRKGSSKRVAASNGHPYDMKEDVTYNSTVPLPNGKTAKRFQIFVPGTDKPIGRITETNAYKDTKISGSRLVSRKDVVGYNAETYNEKYPIYERSMHTTNRSFAIDWLDKRR